LSVVQLTVTVRSVNPELLGCCLDLRKSLLAELGTGTDAGERVAYVSRVVDGEVALGTGSGLAALVLRATVLDVGKIAVRQVVLRRRADLSPILAGLGHCVLLQGSGASGRTIRALKQTGKLVVLET